MALPPAAAKIPLDMSALPVPSRLKLTIDQHRLVGELVALGAEGSPLADLAVGVDDVLGPPLRS